LPPDPRFVLEPFEPGCLDTWQRGLLAWASGALLRAREARALAAVAGFAWLLAGGGAMAERAQDGAVTLPEPRVEGQVSVERAISKRRSVREYADEPLSLAAAAQLLWAAQGVTGSGGLRAAPSAGALYPLEVYLVAGAVEDVRPGVYRYEPARHRLLAQGAGDRRAALADAALEQAWLAEAPATLVLAAVPARTARKYGPRAERFVPMEAGLAAENVGLQAVALGLGSVVVGAFDDARVQRVLELAPEVEPLALLPVGRPR
jgi:SagB-type dehydrogenase family enzyme